MTQRLTRSRRAYRDARAAEIAAMRAECEALAPQVRAIANRYGLAVSTITKHIKQIAGAGR